VGLTAVEITTKQEVNEMQMINAILLFLALILMWSTLSLDRSSGVRISNDQSTQLNDSMEFLRKLKGKSANEESQTRRIDAYRKTVEQSLKDNPDSINEILNKFDSGSEVCGSLLRQIISSSLALSNDLSEIKQSIDKTQSNESQEASQTVYHLRELLDLINQLETSSSDVESFSRDLSVQISEVKSGVVY
jgi:hypothetical protein